METSCQARSHGLEMPGSQEQTGHKGKDTWVKKHQRASVDGWGSSMTKSLMKFHFCFGKSSSPNSSSEEASRLPLTVAIQLRAGQVLPLIPGKLSFAMHSSVGMTKRKIDEEKSRFYFSSHCQDLYEPFCLDFGPVNLLIVHNFCNFMRGFWDHPRLAGRELVYYTDETMDIRTNTAFLLAAFMIIQLGYTPEKAWAPFTKVSKDSFATFRDATFCPQDYHLTVLACLQGLTKAMECKFYVPDTFDFEDYGNLEDPGVDMHVVCPKFIAFKGPQKNRDQEEEEEDLFTLENYIEVFRNKGVTTVVRLNEANTYDSAEFTESGIDHHDLYFDDCTVPTDSTVKKFLDICEKAPGMVAVHCKAGLGRTGTLIAIYLMKHFGFTASECIGWLRIVRPGSVIGPQQRYLHHVEKQFRAAKGHTSASAKSAKSQQSCLDLNAFSMDMSNIGTAESKAMGMLIADAQKARAARLAKKLAAYMAGSDYLIDGKYMDQISCASTPLTSTTSFDE